MKVSDETPAEAISQRVAKFVYFNGHYALACVFAKALVDANVAKENFVASARLSARKGIIDFSSNDGTNSAWDGVEVSSAELDAGFARLIAIGECRESWKSNKRLIKCLCRFQHIYDLNVRRKRHIDFYAVSTCIKFIMYGDSVKKALKKIKGFIREQCRNPLSKKIVPTRKGKPHFREIEFKNKRKML